MPQFEAEPIRTHPDVFPEPGRLAFAGFWRSNGAFRHRFSAGYRLAAWAMLRSVRDRLLDETQMLPRNLQLSTC
jgi:hypothetical protein